MNFFINTLKASLHASIRAKEMLLSDPSSLKAFSEAVEAVVGGYRSGGRLFVAGNGGSAADAQHLATEFVVKMSRSRSSLPAEALTVDTSTITAIGNDFGFEEIFSRQIEGKMTRRDVFLAITTSGNSPNILRAVEKCRELKITSVVFSGKGGGKVKDLADHCVIAPGEDVSVIQEVHSVFCHALCGCVEQLMFPEVFKAVTKQPTSQLSNHPEVTIR